jgi:hypothetical protein
MARLQVMFSVGDLNGCQPAARSEGLRSDDDIVQLEAFRVLRNKQSGAEDQINVDQQWMNRLDLVCGLMHCTAVRGLPVLYKLNLYTQV